LDEVEYLMSDTQTPDSQLVRCPGEKGIEDKKKEPLRWQGLLLAEDYQHTTQRMQ
jgi:hypothetical protein